MSVTDERQWAKDRCPVGCCNPDAWNLGCWQCEERHDAYEIELPCKKWNDEVSAMVERTVGSMSLVIADVPIEIDGRRVKEAQTAALLWSVRYAIKPVADELLRARLRIAELEASEKDEPC